MTERLVAIIRGRHFYEVVEDERPLFTGTLAECRRFESLHQEKFEEFQRPKRRREQPQARIFRIWAGSAAASSF
jgi:hypothetical protein